MNKINPIKTVFIVFITCLSPPLFADRAASINALFDQAEVLYPNFFVPAKAVTQTLNEWTYRYYPATDTYAGVNTQDQVYVLGGPFGGSPVYIDRLETLLNSIGYVSQDGETDMNPGNGQCVTIALIKPNTTVKTDISKYNSSGAVTSIEARTEVFTVSDKTTLQLDQFNIEKTSDGTDISSQNGHFDYQYEIREGLRYIRSIGFDLEVNVAGNSSVNLEGLSTKADGLSTFAPTLVDRPASVFCEGQQWESDKVIESATQNGVVLVPIERSLVIGEVTAVNVPITVAAGNFNTVLLTRKNFFINEIIEERREWLDIGTGVVVKIEIYQAGVLKNVFETLSIQ